MLKGTLKMDQTLLHDASSCLMIPIIIHLHEDSPNISTKRRSYLRFPSRSFVSFLFTEISTRTNKDFWREIESVTKIIQVEGVMHGESRRNALTCLARGWPVEAMAGLRGSQGSKLYCSAHLATLQK